MLTEQQNARLMALHAVQSVLSVVNRINGLDYSYRSNPYIDEKRRRRIDREVDEIRRQIDRRVERLERSLYL